MLGFFKKLFGSEPSTTPVPYKVEAPAETAVNEPALPFPAPKPAKKPSVKKATTAKPKKPRAPKA
jgi:hypothetical protein